MDVLGLATLADAASGGHGFVRDLAVVLCVAAVTTVLFQRLRQPVVLGYLLAGLIVGPHLFFQLVGDTGTIQTLSELGVILLMLSIGLEFRFHKLIELGPSAAFTTVVEVGLMLWLGFSVGHLFGWSTRECLFAGGIVAVSSTLLIRKVFTELSVERNIREIVTGVLVFEDLVAVLLLAVLTALSAGAEFDASIVGEAALRLAVFLALTIGVGLMVIPRAFRAILSLKRKETVLVAAIGLSFAVALLAERAQCSSALGAFLAGMLIAESGEGEWIEELVRPVRDMFAAIFFVSVGMLIDPRLLLVHWVAVVVLAAVVLVGKVVGVSFGTFLTGKDTTTALRSGLCMAQIGELSFVIAAIGVTSKAAGEFLYPVAVGVSSLTAFLSPWLIRESAPIASFLDARLPRALSTFTRLYGSWIATIRARTSRDKRWKSVRRAGIVVLLDGALLAGLLIAGSVGLGTFQGLVERATGLEPRWSRALVVGLLAGLCVFPWTGIARGARRLAVTLSEMALPPVAVGRPDTGAAPRRALVVGLQFAIVLCIGVPIAVVTEPFLPRFASPAVVLVLVAPVAYMLWRSAANLEGHVRAGAEIIVEALAQTPKDERTRALEEVTALLPGLGDLTMVRIDAGGPAAEKAVRELGKDLLRGVSVVAIVRGDLRLALPGGNERLRGGDLVALTGTPEDVERAVKHLTPESAHGPGARPTHGEPAASATDGTGAGARRGRDRRGP
ncbi:MAG: cation:proton antiporter [Planctomycetes bacterium]|nr:cation:proton antiporter [Planctomycetota bacterium]